jgi:hypothetical protein
MPFPTARGMLMKTLMVPAFAVFVVLLSSGSLAAQQRAVTHDVAPNTINLSLPDLGQSGAPLPRLVGSGRPLPGMEQSGQPLPSLEQSGGFWADGP